jgi:phosphatidylserine/phosphatidylglycerophosphate/cardiolipin synthase-like enzyme
MNVYIPLHLYKVRYETAWGRPHSELDKLILRTLQEKPATLEQIRISFALRAALVVEVLVTMARSGWIALDAGSNAFYATSIGRRALTDNELPPFINIQPDTATILMERVKGGIATTADLHPLTAFSLKDNSDFNDHTRFPEQPQPRRLDMGQVDGLLRCESPKWLHWVDTPVRVSETCWARVHVDAEREEIIGLPERWRRSLGENLLDFASKGEGPRRSRLFEESSNVSEQTRWHDVELAPQNVLWGPEAHAGLLIRSLDEAKSIVYAASAFFNPTSLGDNTREALLRALNRGIRVALLWGYEEGAAAKQVIQWLKALRKSAGESGRNLLFNEAASGSHAKFLLCDPEGELSFYLGSYNWLSSPPSSTQGSFNMTLRVLEPGLLAELLRTFAALWMNVPQMNWSPAAAYLQQIVAELSQKAVKWKQAYPGPNSCRIRLIRDQEHESVMLDLLQAARERCWVASHKLGPKADIRLTPLKSAKKRTGLKAIVQYDLSLLEPDQLAKLKQDLESQGVRFERRERFHAKALVVDSHALISSFNFLSADPFNNASNAREVGLLIDGGPLPEELWNLCASK